MTQNLKDALAKHPERRQSTDSTRSTNSIASTSSDIQQHLQSMFILLRNEETLKMAVKLESHHLGRTRYLAIVSHSLKSRNPGQQSNNKSKNNVRYMQLKSSSNCTFQESKMNKNNDNRINNLKHKYEFLHGLQKWNKCCNNDTENNSSNIQCNTEESCLLGIDCNEKTTIGLVLRILADTAIRLDGDGGFSITIFGKTHNFKPVSVQAMWSALQTLHKVSHSARENNFYPGGPSHSWVSYYENKLDSDRSCINEWNKMDSIEIRRHSPYNMRNRTSNREETELIIRRKLKEIMMSVDLDETTSKYIRFKLEKILNTDLHEYKSFIDEEMLTILGQMDSPTEIFEHVYLGSEWNASNLEELQRNGVRHILNVTREIDNFFPGMFDYFNVRVYDDDKTNLLKHWDNTYRYINRAKAEGSKVLVHCKMGISRSASVVIAYAMKAYNWDFNKALKHVKQKRTCIQPNKNFLTQLETYCGMLDAMKNREKLQRSKSETCLDNAKDARLLPGSEPTPLIQALQNARKRNSRKIKKRSSSSSPIKIKPIKKALRKRPQSLENLFETILLDEQKNVRFPGYNGQHYSVSQNQIIHIQQNWPLTSVKTIVNEIESGKEKVDNDKLCFINSAYNTCLENDLNKYRNTNCDLLCGNGWNLQNCSSSSDYVIGGLETKNITDYNISSSKVENKLVFPMGADGFVNNKVHENLLAVCTEQKENNQSYIAPLSSNHASDGSTCSTGLVRESSDDLMKRISRESFSINSYSYFDKISILNSNKTNNSTKRKVNSKSLRNSHFPLVQNTVLSRCRSEEAIFDSKNHEELHNFLLPSASEASIPLLGVPSEYKTKVK